MATVSFTKYADGSEVWDAAGVMHPDCTSDYTHTAKVRSFDREEA